MIKNILGFALVLLVFVSPVLAQEANAATLSVSQMHTIVQLLQSFGLDQTSINNLQSVLGSTGGVSVGGLSASITINGQTTVSDADPLVPRTWAWASSPAGATVSGSVIRSGCGNAAQNGTTNPWTPWSAGGSANGSNTAVLGAAYYGCTVTATYTVTNAAGQSATSRATIRFKSSATTSSVSGSSDLCAQQGLTNAAGQQPNLPLGIGLFSEVLTPGMTPGKSFQIYAFEPNQAVVFPLTVKQFNPNDPNSGLTLRIDTSTYTGIENIVSVSKDKCDFSQALETMDVNGGRRIGYQGLAITNISNTDLPAFRSPYHVQGYAYLAPGNYYINIRPALHTDATDGRGGRILVRPIQDAVMCGDGKPRHAGSPCNVYVNGLGLVPDFTPFGTAGGTNPRSTYTCSNGAVAANASLCTSSSTPPAQTGGPVQLSPSETPGWGEGPGIWSFTPGPMQSSPPPPGCNSLVHEGGHCAIGGLCVTQDFLNRYVCR